MGDDITPEPRKLIVVSTTTTDPESANALVGLVYAILKERLGDLIVDMRWADNVIDAQLIMDRDAERERESYARMARPRQERS